MYKRIGITSASDEQAKSIAHMIVTHFPNENWRIVDPIAHLMWGLEPDERVIVVNAGPLESLVNFPGKDPESALKAWDAMSHYIFSPLVEQHRVWSPAILHDAALFRAFQYVNTYGSRLKPYVILPHQSKENNAKLVRSLLTGIILAENGNQIKNQ